MSTWQDSQATSASMVHTGDHLRSSSSVYSIQEYIGEGCYGKVARCTNLATKDPVAVKILKDSYYIENAEKEASMLEVISVLNPDRHNIVKFLERFEYDGQTCLAFESLDKSLHDALQERDWDPLYLNEIRPIAKQLFVALDALKGLGILHADLKPDNIMFVNRQDQPSRIKVIDFGEAISASSVQPGAELQPLGYRAPEIVLGLPFTEAIDVWGVGCILAFLFLADDIFPAESEYQMMHSMLEVLGQPADHLLHAGKFAQNYFSVEETDDGPTWRLRESGYKAAGWTLDGLVDYYPKESAAEAEDTKAFVDLLKRLLHLDGDQRICPREALQHPFITMSHLTNRPDSSSYLTTAQSMMTVCSTEESEDRVDTSLALQHGQELLGSSSDGIPVTYVNDEDPAPQSHDEELPIESSDGLDLSSLDKELPGTDTASASYSWHKTVMERIHRFFHRITSFCCCLHPTEDD